MSPEMIHLCKGLVTELAGEWVVVCWANGEQSLVDRSVTWWDGAAAIGVQGAGGRHGWRLAWLWPHAKVTLWKETNTSVRIRSNVELLIRVK